MPKNCGLGGEAVSAVLVVIGLTVNEAVPVEGEKPFPTVGVKTALKLSVPTGSVDVWTWPRPRSP